VLEQLCWPTLSSTYSSSSTSSGTSTSSSKFRDRHPVCRCCCRWSGGHEAARRSGRRTALPPHRNNTSAWSLWQQEGLAGTGGKCAALDPQPTRSKP
jgi:hypothetical protein